MPKVYCKHCYSYVGLELGDGIWMCSKCEAGLAPMGPRGTFGEEGFRSYKKWMEHITKEFIARHRQYLEKKSA